MKKYIEEIKSLPEDLFQSMFYKTLTNIFLGVFTLLLAITSLNMLFICTGIIICLSSIAISIHMYYLALTGKIYCVDGICYEKPFLNVKDKLVDRYYINVKYNNNVYECNLTKRQYKNIQQGDNVKIYTTLYNAYQMNNQNIVINKPMFVLHKKA